MKKNDKLDFLKTENFCFAKATHWRKYLQMVYPIKDCYPKFTKNF